MVKIRGILKHRKRLRRSASAEMARAVVASLYEVGQRIELDAEFSITSGSVSGPNHVPSEPGQPPNADTRHLDTNIDTTIAARSPPTVHVTSHAEYSASLEFGTSKMAERPFMGPATKKNEGLLAREVASAVSRVNKRPV